MGSYTEIFENINPRGNVRYWDWDMSMTRLIYDDRWYLQTTVATGTIGMVVF